MDLPEDDQPEDEPRQDRVHFLKVDGETSAHGVRLFLSVLLLQKILAEIFCDGNIILELLDKSIIRAHNGLYKRITERRWGRMRFLNEILLSVMEISRQEDEVANAYFGGDQERIRDFLADSYDGEIEVYTDTDREVTGMTAIKGLENMEESEIGDTKEISMECSMSNTGEGLLYLTLEMVKQEDGWKIEFYGLEM